MKKLLFYFNSLQPSGGIERVIVTLANKLCNDYDITILVKDAPKTFYILDHKVKLVSLENQLIFDMNNKIQRFFTAIKSVVYNTIALKKFFRNNSFDYYYLAHPLNVLEYHFARGINNFDTIISEHGSPNAYNIFYKQIKNLLYFKAKVYVIPTQTDTIFYKSLNLPVQYVPHFKSELKYVKSELNENIALNIGRFTDVKQQIFLLQIWNSLVNERKIKNWKLFIVGEGELKSQFENYIQVNKLEDHVFLLPPKQDVSYYFNQSSLFLLTSKSEGFGMVLLEAVSFGLPCISFDCPSGPRDIIFNNENGFLVTLNNKYEFEDYVLKIINNDKLKLHMGNRSYEISKDWDDIKLLKEWHIILD